MKVYLLTTQPTEDSYGKPLKAFTSFKRLENFAFKRLMKSFGENIFDVKTEEIPDDKTGQTIGIIVSASRTNDCSCEATYGVYSIEVDTK